jgi:hypothetical protein
MRLSRTWLFLATAVGIASGALIAATSAEAQAATYCERDECINWTTCWDHGVLPVGCDMVYGSPQCQQYFCGQT